MMYDLPDYLQKKEKSLFQYCDWEYQDIYIGERRIISSFVKNTNSLLDDLIEKDGEDEDVLDERIPYWADIWPSSIGLSAHILGLPGDWQNVKAIEIGCGLGLAGMAAGMIGMDVLLTDYLSEPLEFVEVLWWRNFGRSARTKLLDWREPDPDLKADVLIASDVIYESRSYEPVLEAFERLTKPGARILLSEPGRGYSKPFIELLRASRFEVSTNVRTVSYEEETFDIDIYDILHPVS